jgi:hypothetical protein
MKDFFFKPPYKEPNLWSIFGLWVLKMQEYEKCGNWM